MTITASQLDELASWCAQAPSLDAAQEEAMRTFFGVVAHLVPVGRDIWLPRPGVV